MESNDEYGTSLQNINASRFGIFRHSASEPGVEMITVMRDNNFVGIGATNPGYLLQLGSDSAAKPNGGSWTNSSDARLKENIVLANTTTCYENIKKLPLKYWKWRDDIETFRPENIPDRHKLGWIAQDVLETIPKAVTVSNSYGYEDCLWLNPDQIYATLYGALQKTMTDKEVLEANVTQLTIHVDSLESRIAAIEAKLAS
jgi:hypothetical protein